MSVSILVCRQIVEGLRHLLSKGLVHCNLSVDTIYLHSTSRLRICLSDHGLRPLLNNDDLQVGTTKTQSTPKST